MKHLNKMFESNWDKPTNEVEQSMLIENLFDTYLDDDMSEIITIQEGTKNFRWLQEIGVEEKDFLFGFTSKGGFFIRLFLPEYKQFGVMSSLSDINSLYSELDTQKEFLRGLKPKLMNLDKYGYKWQMKMRGLGQNQFVGKEWDTKPFRISVKGKGYIVCPPVVHIIILAQFRIPLEGSSYLWSGPNW